MIILCKCLGLNRLCWLSPSPGYWGGWQHAAALLFLSCWTFCHIVFSFSSLYLTENIEVFLFCLPPLMIVMLTLFGRAAFNRMTGGVNVAVSRAPAQHCGHAACGLRHLHYCCRVHSCFPPRLFPSFSEMFSSHCWVPRCVCDTLKGFQCWIWSGSSSYYLRVTGALCLHRSDVPLTFTCTLVFGIHRLEPVPRSSVK